MSTALKALNARNALAALCALSALSGGCVTADAEAGLAALDVDRPVANGPLPPVPGRITVDDAGRLAIARNPELAAARAALPVKDAEAERAGLWPDPSITAGVAQPVASTTGETTGAAVGVDWDLGDVVTAGASRKAALLAADAARLALAYEEIVVAGDARVQAARVASLAQQLEVASEARASTQRLLDAALAARATGDVTVEALGIAHVAALDAESRALEISRALDEARALLGQALGLPPGTPVEVSAVASPPPAAGGTARLFALARAQRPDLVGLERAYDGQEQALAAAMLGEFPRFTVNVEGARDPGGFFTAGGGASITVPIFNGNRGAVAVERATRDQLRAEYHARLQAVRADIDRLLRARTHAREQRDALAARLPLLEKTDAALDEAVKSGNATLFTRAEVRAALVDARLRALALSEDEVEQWIALQTAVGAPLPPAGSPR